MRHKYLWIGSIMGFILLLDQITKHLIVIHVRLYEIIPVVPGFFNITHVRNKGAAFSLFSESPAAFRMAFFVSMSLAALAVIAVVLRKTHDRLLIIAFSLIAGGAVGNLTDRLRYGEVVDFIQWYVKSWYWPSFNVADSAITAGVTLLAIDLLFRKPKQEEVSQS